MTEPRFMVLDPHGQYDVLDHQGITTISWEDPERKIIRITALHETVPLLVAEDITEFTFRLAQFIQAVEINRLDVAVQHAYPNRRTLH